MIDRVCRCGRYWSQYWSQCWGMRAIALLLCVLSVLITSCQSTTNPNITRLTLWHGINPPPNRDVFQTLVDRFNQTHDDVQVEALYIGQPDQQLPKILTAVVGNAPPDILWYTPSITGQLVELGAIRPIENWLNAAPVKADLDPSLMETMALNGHLWSIPLGTNNAAVFYRPDLFEAAGIEALPRTWEEFRTVAKQLTRDTNGDGKLDTHGILLPLGKGEWTVFIWLPFMYSAGGELLQDRQPNLVNPGAIAALEFWSALVEDGSAIKSQPERGYEQEDFLAGRVAMQLTGPWTLGYLPDAGVPFDVFPIPISQEQAAVVGGENLFVMKTAPERERAALEFFEYVLSEEFQTEWALGTGYLPVNLAARRSEAYQAFVAEQPSLKVFLEQMDNARARPILPNYARLSENLGRAIEAVLLGASPEQALQKAQQRLDLIWQE